MEVLIIPIYERPKYLWQTLQSIEYSGFGLAKTEKIILSDDGSVNPNIELMCTDFLKDRNGQYIKHPNYGIAGNMKTAIDLCGDSDIIITLDSDFIVKKDFKNRLIKPLENEGVDTIITGFNATSHPIQYQLKGYQYCIKHSIGGGNLCFTWQTYMKHIRPSLVDNMWDWRMVRSIQNSHGRLLCTTPSVVQHIGVHSTVGHIRADIAVDF